MGADVRAETVVLSAQRLAQLQLKHAAALEAASEHSEASSAA